MSDANTQGVTTQRGHAGRSGSDAYLKQWEHAGSGQLCSGCSKRIERDVIEIDIELPPELKSVIARFHVECFRVWSGEAASDPY